MEIDFSKLVEDILAAIKGVVSKGFKKVKKLIEADAKDLAMRSKVLAQLRLSGELGEAEFIEEVDRGKRLVKSIGMTVAALASITLEKAWNAVVKVVWGTLNGVMKAAGLSVLTLPAAPTP